MADYKQQAVSGEQRTRCYLINISNPRAGQPSVQFCEESVLTVGASEIVTNPSSPLNVPFDPAKVIPLRDPVTGELTGAETTMGAAYAILYSAYLASALERDEAEAAKLKGDPQ